MYNYCIYLVICRALVSAATIQGAASKQVNTVHCHVIKNNLLHIHKLCVNTIGGFTVTHYACYTLHVTYHTLHMLHTTRTLHTTHLS